MHSFMLLHSMDAILYTKKIDELFSKLSNTVYIYEEVHGTVGYDKINRRYSKCYGKHKN